MRLLGSHIRKGLEMKKLSIKFQVVVSDDDVQNFEYYLKDLLETSVLPALSAELRPLSLSVVKSKA